MIRIYSVIIMAFALSACGAKHTLVRSTPGYEQNLKNERTSMVLTPEVEVNTVDTFGKKERQYDYEDRLENTIVEVLIPKLNKKGLHAQLLKRKDVRDHQLSASVIKVKDSFNDSLVELYPGNDLWLKEKAFTTNKYVNAAKDFHEKLNADLLIMVNFYYENKTSGSMKAEFAKHVLLRAVGVQGSSDETEKTRVKIAIIDSLTGKILWTHSVGVSSNIIASSYNSFCDTDKVDREKLAKLFDAALDDLYGQTVDK